MTADLFWKMNTAGSAADKAMGEKHAPVITCAGPCQTGKHAKIKVDIGGGKHPNENGHHIQWIELRCNGLYVARAEFAPVIMDPVVEFTVVMPGPGTVEWSAVARCNLHGLWESKQSCTITAA